MMVAIPKIMRFFVTRQIRSILTIAFAACLGSSLASAQRGPDVFFGVGTAMDSSSNGSIDTFGTGFPYTTPKLGGAFAKIGGDFMVTKQLGIGAETDFRFTQAAYAGLQTRPMFYDFNLIYMPSFHGFKRVVPEFQGGLGGTHLGFNYNESSCNQLSGCSTSTSQVDSSNHFQVHVSAGLRIYATNHIFFRPQVDAHYVNNFFQYGSNWVPEYGASLGWSFGER
jgi:hypothetical protein